MRVGASAANGDGVVSDEYSVLIGGQAGDGIRQASDAISRLFNRLGYWVFSYEDYGSLIRGGHDFAIIRAAPGRIRAHREKVDVMMALNQDSVDQHTWRLKGNSLIIFDSAKVKADGLALPLGDIAREMRMPPIVRNTAALGALASVLGVEFRIVEDVIRSAIRRSIEENVAVAERGYDLAKDKRGALMAPVLEGPPKPLISGNEAVALGAVKGGLKLYVAYPMTPSSSILHYLAANADDLGIATVHPENEIAVIGIAEGAAYAGVRSMVGTSGGGFALMVEHLSLAGQAEIPIVIYLGQRPGPSTGVPTYTAQGDLFFAMFAGHGEFPKVVIAPGDPEQAFRLSAEAMNLAWRFQIPVILLGDKHLSESTCSVEIGEGVAVAVEGGKRWSGEGNYERYSYGVDGISPMAFPGTSGAVVKSNSYEHDEYGITTESAELIARGNEKRSAKMRAIEAELRGRGTVNVRGEPGGDVAIVAWGSTSGAAIEVAERHGFAAVQPLYLYPLPAWELVGLLRDRRRVVCAEVNSTGQLSAWLRYHGMRVDADVLKYDGRPFTVDELERRIEEVIA
jgi:2-oxoglutarate ferredoxin oxidoreductase subunit alpha